MRKTTPRHQDETLPVCAKTDSSAGTWPVTSEGHYVISSALSKANSYTLLYTVHFDRQMDIKGITLNVGCIKYLFYTP